MGRHGMLNAMNRKSTVALLVAALLLAWIIAAPWFTAYRIRDAAQTHDAQALASYVDFASVRQSLKDQMNARLLHKMSEGSGTELNPLAALVAPFAGAVVDKLVDAYITPAGVAELMAGSRPNEPQPSAPASTTDEADRADRGARKPLAQTDMAYRSWNRFVVTAHGRNGDTQFVLGRRGLGWKLTEIILAPQ